MNADIAVIDRWIVHARALNFSQGFLDDIGYEEPPPEDRFCYGYLEGDCGTNWAPGLV